MGGGSDGPPRRESPAPLDNEQLADRLEEIAGLLEAQDANPFRVRAYRNAAATIRRLDRPAHALLDEQGVEALRRQPGIGESLARSIEQLAHTGRLGLLDRLRGSDAGDVLTTVPGIGKKLAARVHEKLEVETLAELETAAWDGRLARVEGMGPRRLRMVRESLAGRFRRGPGVPEAQRRPPADEPPVEELLEIDREYRRRAEAGRLARIAPRRFNPSREAWLPVLHTQRGDRHYTALFSNTARAHELGTTRDWVVIYRDDDGGRGQWTVVTGRFGALKGRRIVRGREAECRGHYGREAGAALFDG